MNSYDYTQRGNVILNSLVDPDLIRFTREEWETIRKAYSSEGRDARKKMYERFLKYMLQVNGADGSTAISDPSAVQLFPLEKDYIDAIIHKFNGTCYQFPNPAQQMERIVLDLEAYLESEQSKQGILPGNPAYRSYNTPGDTTRVRILKQFVRTLPLGKKDNEDILVEYLLEKMTPTEREQYDSIPILVKGNKARSKRKSKILMGKGGELLSAQQAQVLSQGLDQRGEMLAAKITDSIFDDLRPGFSPYDYRIVMQKGLACIEAKYKRLHGENSLLKYFLRENDRTTPFGLDGMGMVRRCVACALTEVLNGRGAQNKDAELVWFSKWLDVLDRREDSCSHELKDKIIILCDDSTDNRTYVAAKKKLQSTLKGMADSYDPSKKDELTEALAGAVLDSFQIPFVLSEESTQFAAAAETIRSGYSLAASARDEFWKEKKEWEDSEALQWFSEKYKVYYMMYQLGTAVQMLRGLHKSEEDDLRLLSGDFSSERIQLADDLSRILLEWEWGADELPEEIAKRWGIDFDIEKARKNLPLIFEHVNQLRIADVAEFDKLYAPFMQFDIEAFLSQINVVYCRIKNCNDNQINKENSIKKNCGILRDEKMTIGDRSVSPAEWMRSFSQEHDERSLVDILNDRSVNLNASQIENLFIIYSSMLQLLEDLAQQKILPMYQWCQLNRERAWIFSWLRGCKDECIKEPKKSLKRRDSIEMLERADALGTGYLVQGSNSREYAYMMAFAYGMKVYKTADREKLDSSDYAKCLDLELRLFFEYLGNNLNRLAASATPASKDYYRNNRSYNASGFNYKNPLELAAIYFLLHTELPARVQWAEYEALRDAITKPSSKSVPSSLRDDDFKINRTVRVMEELDLAEADYNTDEILRKLQSTTVDELEDLLAQAFFLRGTSNAIEINVNPEQVMKETEILSSETDQRFRNERAIYDCAGLAAATGLSVTIREELKRRAEQKQPVNEYLMRIFASMKPLMDDGMTEKEEFLYRERLIAAAVKSVLADQWMYFYNNFNGDWNNVPNLLITLKDKVNPILTRSRFEHIDVKNVADQIFITELYYDYMRGMIRLV